MTLPMQVQKLLPSHQPLIREGNINEKSGVKYRLQYEVLHSPSEQLQEFESLLQSHITESEVVNLSITTPKLAISMKKNYIQKKKKKKKGRRSL